MAGAVDPRSDEARGVAGGSATAAGPPSGALAVAEAGVVTATWTPAPAAGSMYSLEIGSGPGQADLAVLTTTRTSITYRAGLAPQYLRVRAVSGAAVSAPSNEVSVFPVSTGCSTPPLASVLLPASTLNGETTLSWLPAGGASADRYRVDAGSRWAEVDRLRWRWFEPRLRLKPGEHVARHRRECLR